MPRRPQVPRRSLSSEPVFRSVYTTLILPRNKLVGIDLTTSLRPHFSHPVPALPTPYFLIRVRVDSETQWEDIKRFRQDRRIQVELRPVVT